jgi:hypothetical membrane protein
MKITTNTMKGFDKGGSRSALCSGHPFQRKNNNRAFQRMTAWAGIIAPILFTFLVAVESLLRQGYSQICNYVSELGVGSYAIIQNTNFIIFGLLSILFALGLEASLPASRGRSKKGVVWLVTVSGLGVMFAGVTLLFIGVFPDDYVFGAHTLTTFVAFLTLIASQLLTWRALKNGDDALWGHYRTYSLVSGLVALALLFVLIYTLGTAYHGATERAFIAVPLIWLAITGTKLESIAKIKQTQELTLRKATEKLSDINEEKESEGPQATALGIDHSPEEVEKMKMHMNMNIDVAFTSLHQICTKRLI